MILGYWNMRGAGRGNPARYLLSYAGADWEDKQYTFGQQEWSQAKSTLMPFANLPHIIDGDFKVTETIAVHQYIAQKLCPQVLGDTPQERGRRYQLQSIANDKFVHFLKMVFVTDDKQRVATLCLQNMQAFVACLGQRNFLDSDTIPCIADFIFFEHIEYGQRLSNGTVYQTYPTLEAYHGRMANLQGVKEFRASDKFISDKYTPDGLSQIEW